MGVNKLNSLMKDCAVKAGIGANKRITNHSARKTLVQKLQDHNVPPTHIAQVTGHKNPQSINNYSCLREEQQEAISSLLSTDTSSPLQTDDSYSARALTLPFKSANNTMKQKVYRCSKVIISLVVLLTYTLRVLQRQIVKF